MHASRSLPYGAVSVQGSVRERPVDREPPPPPREHGTRDPWKDHETSQPDKLHHTETPSPYPVNRMADASKNIILSQTSFAGGNEVLINWKFQIS